MLKVAGLGLATFNTYRRFGFNHDPIDGSAGSLSAVRKTWNEKTVKRNLRCFLKAQNSTYDQ